MKINHDYHCIELKYEPVEVSLWLLDKFGVPGSSNRWFRRGSKLYFEDPKDHLMFLVWISGQTFK